MLRVEVGVVEAATELMSAMKRALELLAIT